MNYNYIQLENRDWELTLSSNETWGTIIIILSEEQDSEGNFVRGLPEHPKMIQDFQDITKLEYFVSLLTTNPTTAFLIYNNNK